MHFVIGTVDVEVEAEVEEVLMMRRDDPAFKKVVDGALKQLFASGEINAIYEKWFMKAIPPRGIVLNFPPSPQWKRIVANPTDSPDPKDYR